jgi:hypothetical protein
MSSGSDGLTEFEDQKAARLSAGVAKNGRELMLGSREVEMHSCVTC